MRNKSVTVLRTLLKVENISLVELALKTKLSQNEVLSAISSINELLVEIKLPEIIQKGEYYFVPEKTLRKSDKILSNFYSSKVVIEPEFRIYALYLYLYASDDNISSYHLQDFMGVSRNTTLTDLKELRQLLASFNVKIVYSRTEGYNLQGFELEIHRAAFYCLSTLRESKIRHWIFDYLLLYLKAENNIENTMSYIEKSVKSLQMKMIYGRLELTILFITFYLLRMETNNHILCLDFDHHLYEKIPLEFMDFTNKIVNKINSKSISLLGNQDIKFLCILLFGSFLSEKPIDDEAFRIGTKKIVEEMEKVSLINFVNKESLIKGLEKHIIPAIYRMRLGFYESDSKSKALIENNREIFNFVKKALLASEQFTIDELDNNEVAYIMAHFSGHMDQYESKNTSGKVRALVLCPNGISSSFILTEELKDVFSNFIFLPFHQIKDIDSISPDDYDLIFSTIHFETNKPLFLVSMLMSYEEKISLYQLVTREFSYSQVSETKMDKIISVISKHATIRDKYSLINELNFILSEEKCSERNYLPMLQDLITENTYQHIDEIDDWESAIKHAALPLLRNNSISDNYVQVMIDKVKELGAFIHVGKQVAIPHARPEDGVNRLGMSMLTLKKPVMLLDDPNHSIKLFVCIAAIDNETHLKALSQLTQILMDDEKVEQLKRSTKFEEINEIIEGASDNA